MRYVSTRGSAPELGFADAMLTALAADGGLYLPDHWPALDPALFDAGLGYAELAEAVMWPFVEGSIERPAFAAIVSAAYGTFDVDDVAPLVEVDDDIWMLELFHGPTLAFKDIALQLLGRLFDHELGARGQRVTIVGATSGDTGSAAIEACRDREAIDIVILHPAGRVSEVQRRQMTTVDASNVHNVAVDGTFDDCQDLVKAMFADELFRKRMRLSAVNSINWARVMAQIVYYVWGATKLGRPLSYAVPTGNFGNVFAGEAARRMGLPVERFVVASNRNDILTRFFSSGCLEISDVHPTLSPSMDIQVSSNLERLLFEIYERDGAAVAELLTAFRANGAAALDPSCFSRLDEHWVGTRLDDEETLAVMAGVYRDSNTLIDPHTAVGLGAARRFRAAIESPIVVMATADPAKFPDAVESATGVRPALPKRMADLHERPERYAEIAVDLHAVERHIEKVIRG
ncbi:MAG: threonine synthase [Acidimicrobiia bacterium]|nr:threonine synthase [Acidimicrobiia bacterium]